MTSLICSTTFSFAWNVCCATFCTPPPPPFVCSFEGRVGTGGILEEAGPIEDASLSSSPSLFPLRFEDDFLRSLARWRASAFFEGVREFVAEFEFEVAG